MLDISSIWWKNFRSYGDYITKFEKLDELGPLLIIGKNGAGKSTITNAILWCLFGRTFTNSRPGDKVVNNQICQDCVVEIKTIDDWIIRRTRNFKGHDDLLTYKNGEDETRSTNKAAQAFIDKEFKLDYRIFSVSSFFGQLNNSLFEMQDQLRKTTIEKLLGLEKINRWALKAKELFKETEDKVAFKRERLEVLKNDVIRYRNLIAENKKHKTNYENDYDFYIAQLCTDIRVLEESVSNWDVVLPQLDKHAEMLDKLDKIIQARDKLKSTLLETQSNRSRIEATIKSEDQTIETLRRKKKELSKIDFDGLLKAHLIANELEEQKRKIDEHTAVLKLEKRGLDQDAKKTALQIKEWKLKKGTICPSCGQGIEAGHIEGCIKDLYSEAKNSLNKSKSISEEINNFKEMIINRPDRSDFEINRLKSEFKLCSDNLINYLQSDFQNQSELENIIAIENSIKSKLDKIEIAITKINPKMTRSDIESRKRGYSDDVGSLQRLKDDLEMKQKEGNPYEKVIEELKSALAGSAKDLKIVNTEVIELNQIASHYQYLWRSYFDRNKIKRMLLSSLIPYLNQRIRYYLECFKSPVFFTFNDNLSIKSEQVSFLECSGGERRRVDASMMFALHDLYLGIYGRQCNIMILDEVDGALDDDSIEDFVDIIKNDFVRDGVDRLKPSTIIIISHRREMFDEFPTTMLVEKNDGYSKLKYI